MNKIPTIKMPSIKDKEVIGIEEPIMSLREAGFYVSSQYYLQGIPGSYIDCYARQSVIERLKEAEKYLPEGLRFKIYDAYRPICIQKRLWDYYYKDIVNNNPDLSVEELEFKTSFFVSKPSYDVKHPSLHSTGGAIDLTLVNTRYEELDMGTKFDDFTDKAWTNHFEEYEHNEKVRDNRRILYNVMIKAGFTNLPSEWWHYDYGTKFWAYFKNTDKLYNGVIDIDFPSRFTLS